MEKVYAIKEMAQIQEMKAILKSGTIYSEPLPASDRRNCMMFTLGINCGLRVGDLLSLKVKDIRGTHFNIREEKTGKTKQQIINDTLRRELDTYVEGKEENDYLFPGENPDAPLTRQQACNVIKAAANLAGVTVRIGTHSMRKTFGYWYYKQYKDIAMLQMIFGHSSQSVTLRYIGVEQDEIDNSLKPWFL